jgi:hypothetical protein
MNKRSRTSPVIGSVLLAAAGIGLFGCGPGARPLILPDESNIPPCRLAVAVDGAILSDDLRTLIVNPGEIVRLNSEISGGRYSVVRWIATADPEARIDAEGRDLIVTRRRINRDADRLTVLRLTGVDYNWDCTGGKFLTDGDRWRRFWQAPANHGTCWMTVVANLEWEFGEYMDGPGGRRELRRESFNEEARLELLVLVAVSRSRMRDESLFGYPIGHYPEPARDPSASAMGLFAENYSPPEGFVEVGRRDARLAVSRHFRLGDFLAPEPSGFPRYLALDLELLRLLECLTARHLPGGGGDGALKVISGFRPPAYNDRLGFDPYSRHQYGDAADLIVDRDPADWIMDDLNGDGEIDILDSRMLAEWVGLARKETGVTGGTGVYPWSADRKRGPFVHVDCRGYGISWEGEADGE